jgi:flavin reductase (DIM6/NTAB) family NADH-FMN oxidoreductase RutF
MGAQVDATRIAALFGQLDREVWLVTARAGSRQGGLIATFVSQASIVPDLPRMLVGIARQHFTWELIEASGAFGLHLLGEEHLDWVYRFGMEKGRQVDKLAGLAVRAGITGSPVLVDARGWLDCRVEARLETGDRTIFLAEVVDGDLTRPGPLLTTKRLSQLASADKLQQLKEQMAHDSAVDAAAILAWRRGRN